MEGIEDAVMRSVWKNDDDGKEIDIVSFSYRTKVGFEPSEGELVMLAKSLDEISQKGSVQLTPSTGDTTSDSLSVTGLSITGFEAIEGEGGSLVKVKVADRRLFWRFATVSLSVNEPRPDGGFVPSSLDGTRPWSLARLVEFLFSHLGETLDCSVLPNLPLVGLRWNGVRVVSVLRALLSLVGFSVGLDFSGNLRLVRIGESTTSVESDDWTEEWHQRRFLSKPDEVEFVGAPVLVWKRAVLKPQAVDTDGVIKDLESVSYLVGKDVGLELACGFASLGERERELARASVGRLFRLPETGGVPLLAADYDGAKAKLTTSIFVPDKKRGFKNIEGVEVPFSVIDAEEGLLLTERLCGTLTKEEIDCLPSIIDGEPVKVNLSEVVLEYPTVRRDANGGVVRWRRRFGNGGGNATGAPAKAVFDFPAAAVVEGSSREKFYEAVAEKIASSILSVPSSVDVCCRRFVGAKDIAPDGSVSCVRLKFEDGAAWTETESAPVLFDFTEVQNDFSVLLGCRWHSGTRVAASADAGVYRWLQNANKTGVLPLVSSAGEEAPAETRIGGRLKSFDEENALPEVDRVVPFEAFNFAYREHRTEKLKGEEAQDRVWALRLVSDDKHRIESELNRSTPVVRLCDENEGDIDDFWRVRAVPSGEDVEAGMAQAGSPTYLPVVSNNLSYRVMWLINRGVGEEGGWLTDVPAEGLGITVRDCPKRPAPPRHIGQVGNIVVLTDDDLICTTSDGDAFVLANIRHDAHFHLDREHDGRIRFTTTPPGVRPTDGWSIVGEMVCDPSLANDNTELKLESGQWCPQIVINSSAVPIYPLGVTLTVDEAPTVSLPLSKLTNGDFDGLSVAEAKKKNADTENRIVEVLNTIFLPDME